MTGASDPAGRRRRGRRQPPRTGQVRNARRRCAADHRHQPSRLGPDAAHRRQARSGPMCCTRASPTSSARWGPGAWAKRIIADERQLVTLIASPPGAGNRPHWHRDFDEWWVVLAGRLQWELTGGTVRAGGQGRHRLGAPGHGAPHPERGHRAVAAARRGHAAGGPLLLPVRAVRLHRRRPARVERLTGLGATPAASRRCPPGQTHHAPLAPSGPPEVGSGWVRGTPRARGFPITRSQRRCTP